ncbi:MAG: lytic murein transglycosylase [Hyphomonadaceae bacterium]|nr:lytic murein transglycosylase [Hyphomonadaceae bacterium]
MARRFLLALAAMFAAAFAAPACAQPAPSFASSGDVGFDAWRAGFAERAVSRGRDPEIVRRLLSGLAPDDDVIAADRRQPEFVSPVWDYVNRAVSASRIERGRQRRAELGPVLLQVAGRYGVDPDIILGIWGLESDFGRAALPYEAPSALATLAFEGRRRAQFETYLLALIEMVERGYAGPQELRSSWAGALGQPQFMPDVYLTTAADWDGDGHRDIWTNPGDIAASIANYLKDRGWRTGEPTFVEVRLPAAFAYELADGRRQTLAAWAQAGVALPDPAASAPAAWAASNPAAEAELFLPAGAQGPALLLLPNFQVIRRYNASDRYALAVSLLARGFAGAPSTLAARWPTELGSLQRGEILELQTLLNGLGLSAGVADGQFGSNTRRAVRAFQASRGLPADGFPTAALLNDVRRAAGVTAPDPTSAPAARPLDAAGVRELQRRLNRLGYNAGAADGVIGTQTRTAIRAFERRAGRTVTGRATTGVLEAVRAAAR